MAPRVSHVLFVALGLLALAAARPDRRLLQSTGCRTVIASGGLNIRDNNCNVIKTLPTGSFVDFTGVRTANKCQAGCDWVQLKWGSGTAWTAASCGPSSIYLAYCNYSFGTPATSYRGVSAPMASATARRWPLAQAQVARPAVCYVATTGALVGMGNQPPSCSSGTEFAAYRDGSKRFHNGIDLFAPAGTAVYATEGGTVQYIIADFYAGTSAVMIKHDSGKVILYGEVDRAVLKRVGDRVEAGTQIGKVGWQSGNTMLHFEIWGKMPSGYYCQSWGKLCADLQNPTAYLLAAQLIP